MNSDLILGLKDAINNELPGNRAHQRMISYSRPTAEVVRKLNAKPRRSAVLILLHQKEDQWYFPLIKRQAYNGVHSKQISLPGGKYEKSDGNLSNTSLRETEEELGIAAKSINLIGSLSEIYIPPSNFLVKPYVGFLEESPNYIPDPIEVERVIETSLSSFLALPIEKREKYVRDGDYKAQVSSFIVDEEVVWGATAMMLSEFKMIIEENELI